MEEPRHLAKQDTGLADPLESFFDVTPNDSADLAYATRAVYIGTAGDLKFTGLHGGTVTLTNAEIGWHPIRAARIFSTGTTADDIVGAY